MSDFALAILESSKFSKNNKKSDNSKEDKKIVRFVRLIIKQLTYLFCKSGLFKSVFGSRLYYLLYKKGFQSAVSKIQLNDELCCWIIKLPFTASKLNQLNPTFIKGFLEKTCESIHVDRDKCYLAKSIYSYIRPDIFRPASDADISKALLNLALEELFNKNGVRIDALDIVIIPGDDMEELITVIRLLEPDIKYIQVASEMGESLESKLTDIFADSGLSISVSSNFKSLFKHANPIINLGELKKISEYRTDPKALVISLCTQDDKHYEKIIIKGIEYHVDNDVYNKLGSDVLEFFNKKELSDIIISQMSGVGGECRFTYENILEVLKNFRKCGCKIKAFVGQRGVLDIKKLVI